MIFGDTASGKSTFAEKLADIEKLPVIHLDQIMESIGREERVNIGQRIKEEASKPKWVIEGNAFTKDPRYRIEQADKIFLFDFNRFVTLANHVTRYIKIKANGEVRKGSESTSLNLRYFVPYILFKFPSRKKLAHDLAESLEKEIVVFKSYRAVDKFFDSETN
jgi:adenylate kinase family enzyme